MDRKGIKNTSVKDIWNEVYGINQKSPVKDFDEELMLVELCKKNDVPYQMIKNTLLTSVISKYTRRKNIFIRLENHLEEHIKSLMRISKVHLHNFKVYEGHNHIDCTVT